MLCDVSYEVNSRVDQYFAHKLIWKIYGAPRLFTFTERRDRVVVRAPLDDHPQQKTGDAVTLPEIQVGRRFRFSVRATPRQSNHGRKRYLINVNDQRKWFLDRSVTRGFRVIDDTLNCEGEPRPIYREKGPFILNDVLFTGLLVVEDAERFRDVVENGFGINRSMGHGLMMLESLDA